MKFGPTIWIGFEPRETEAFIVARNSILRYWRHAPINGVVLDQLQRAGLYTRPTERRLGRLYDTFSKTDDYDGAMSTEFAVSRFLVPWLARGGLALFMDCDMLARTNISPVFESFDRSKALMCVKHDHQPVEDVKMDNQAQTRYRRKNWSSFMIFNCDHPANKRLTLEMINGDPERGIDGLPGRDLHALCWLKDDEIGELSPEWNWLVGHSDPALDPKVVHFTDGIPTMAGFRDVPYADEFFGLLNRWAA